MAYLNWVGSKTYLDLDVQPTNTSWSFIKIYSVAYDILLTDKSWLQIVIAKLKERFCTVSTQIMCWRSAKLNQDDFGNALLEEVFIRLT